MVLTRQLALSEGNTSSAVPRFRKKCSKLSMDEHSPAYWQAFSNDASSSPRPCFPHRLKTTCLHSLNLTPILLRSSGRKYQCLLCSCSLLFSSYSLAEQHVFKMHEEMGFTNSDGIFFVPCYLNCGQLWKLGLPHFHCHCGIVLHSKQAVLNHQSVVGACYAARTKSSEVDEVRRHPAAGDTIGNAPAQAVIEVLASSSVADTDSKIVFVTRPVTFSDGLRTVCKSVDVVVGSIAKHKVGNSSKVPPSVSHTSLAFQRPCYTEDSDFESAHESDEELALGTKESERRRTNYNFINLRCPLCDQKLQGCHLLNQHFLARHAILFENCRDQLRTKTHSFTLARDFYAWKCTLEWQCKAYFALKRRLTPTVGDDADDIDRKPIKLFFACAHGWASGRTPLQVNKRQRQCPAYIRAFYRPELNKVKVAYCDFHYGHSLDEETFMKHIKRSLHAVLSFRHKARYDAKQIRRRSSEDFGPYLDKALDKVNSDNIISTGAASAALDADLRPKYASADLDQSMGYYWELVRRRLATSDDYSLTLDGRWTNNQFFLDSDERMCRFCKFEFKSHKNLLKHILIAHQPRKSNQQRPNSKYHGRLRCYFCNMQMSRPDMKYLIQHYVNAHDQIQIQLKTRIFDSFETFQKWRNSLAHGTLKRRKTYVNSKNELRQYWVCRLSGKLVNESAGVEKGHCPAWMMALTENINGPVQVSYCLNHIGHHSPTYFQPEAELHPLDDFAAAAPSFDDIAVDFGFSDKLSLPLYANHDNSSSTGADCHASKTVESPLSAFEMMAKGICSTAVNIKNSGASGITPIKHEPCRLIPLDLDGGSSSVLNATRMTLDFDRLISPDSATKTDRLRLPGNERDIIQVQSSTTSSRAEPRTNMSESNKISNGDKNQISVLIRSLNSNTRLVNVPLSDFPIVMDPNDGKYYAVEENSLISRLALILSEQGDELYEGDQIEILQ